MGTPGRDTARDIDTLFDDEERAVEHFFSPPVPPASRRGARPSHYKVISISLYREDIERLATLVEALKAKGHTRANKSMVIREALRQIDLGAVPRQR